MPISKEKLKVIKKYNFHTISEDEKMEYYELFNFKNNEIKELKDKTKKIIEYLLDYPNHAREEDFMQHIKEIEDLFDL